MNDNQKEAIIKKSLIIYTISNAVAFIAIIAIFLVMEKGVARGAAIFGILACMGITSLIYRRYLAKSIGNK